MRTGISTHAAQPAPPRRPAVPPRGEPPECRQLRRTGTLSARLAGHDRVTRGRGHPRAEKPARSAPVTRRRGSPSASGQAGGVDLWPSRVGHRRTRQHAEAAALAVPPGRNEPPTRESAARSWRGRTAPGSPRPVARGGGGSSAVRWAGCPSPTGGATSAGTEGAYGRARSGKMGHALRLMGRTPALIVEAAAGLFGPVRMSRRVVWPGALQPVMACRGREACKTVVPSDPGVPYLVRAPAGKRAVVRELQLLDPGGLGLSAQRRSEHRGGRSGRQPVPTIAAATTETRTLSLSTLAGSR